MATSSDAKPAKDNENASIKVEVRYKVIETHGYKVGRTIGKGSYSEVHLATSERHKDYVAIKVVSKFQSPSEFLAKFLPREIEVVKKLNHPNLIRFFQSVETTHRLYIVMEYASNGTLLAAITRAGFIEETPRAQRWFSQLQSAVAYCHSQGVVHRDIKCENILLDNNFNVKLSDFGFARSVSHPSNSRQAMLSETFCGSYAYAPPEILKGVPYDPKLSDAWSLGIVLYAMVFGKLPFDDSNYPDLIKQVESQLKIPEQPLVSEQCKLLIRKLVAPLKGRLRVSQVSNEPWMVSIIAN